MPIQSAMKPSTSFCRRGELSHAPVRHLSILSVNCLVARTARLGQSGSRKSSVPAIATQGKMPIWNRKWFIRWKAK